MRGPDPGEELAKQMLSTTLKAAVRQHDVPGGGDSMYDLTLTTPNGDGAVEVVGAIDAATLELTKLLHAQGEPWQDARLRYLWVVDVESTARADRLKVELPAFLAALEGREQGFITEDDEEAAALGVTSVFMNRTARTPGSIYIRPDSAKFAAFVPKTGDVVSNWAVEFLRDPQRADVLYKLRISECVQRHAFIWVPSITTAPAPIVLLLTGDPRLPTIRPELPPEVTHLWVATTWRPGVAYHWSEDSGWNAWIPFPVAH